MWPAASKVACSASSDVHPVAHSEGDDGDNDSSPLSRARPLTMRERIDLHHSRPWRRDLATSPLASDVPLVPVSEAPAAMTFTPPRVRRVLASPSDSYRPDSAPADRTDGILSHSELVSVPHRVRRFVPSTEPTQMLSNTGSDRLGLLPQDESDRLDTSASEIELLEPASVATPAIAVGRAIRQGIPSFVLEDDLRPAMPAVERTASSPFALPE